MTADSRDHVAADGGREAPPCTGSGCDSDADFWVYDSDEDGWQPVCSQHTVQLHPSLEVRAWLESGYASPIELGRPDGPSQPPAGRPTAFREMVERAMGWK